MVGLRIFLDWVLISKVSGAPLLKENRFLSMSYDSIELREFLDRVLIQRVFKGME